jgi:hypothetical protein
MERSDEILPLNEAETENVSGGGNVGNLYFYTRMRELTAGLTNPATETASRLRDAFVGATGRSDRFLARAASRDGTKATVDDVAVILHRLGIPPSRWELAPPRAGLIFVRPRRSLRANDDRGPCQAARNRRTASSHSKR